MTEKIEKLTNIITLEDYISKENDYNHLIEVQFPPADVNMFKVRFNFDMGTPLIGDLILDVETESLLELHPFPEWVVYLRSRTTTKSTPYLIVPNLSKKFMRKLNRKSVDQRIDLIKDELKDLKQSDLLAFEYKLGINILVPAFTPHLFISSKIDKESGDNPPYLQVFEPKLDELTKNLKIKTTYFFNLPYKVSV